MNAQGLPGSFHYNKSLTFYRTLRDFTNLYILNLIEVLEFFRLMEEESLLTKMFHHAILNMMAFIKFNVIPLLMGIWLMHEIRGQLKVLLINHTTWPSIMVL